MKFYVTVIREAQPKPKVGWLAGPFATKEGAEAHVPAAREAAHVADPWTDFDAFGVTGLELAEIDPNRIYYPPGKLNSRIELLEPLSLR